MFKMKHQPNGEKDSIGPEIDILFLKNTLFQSKQDIDLGKYRLFSAKFKGLIFQRVYDPALAEFEVGHFRFKGVYLAKWVANKKYLSHSIFIITCILRAFRIRYQCKKVKYVLASDPHSSGVIAWVLASILGAKLVVEFNGNTGARKTWNAYGKNWMGHLKYHYCQLVVPFVMRRSFAIKLLYAKQLEPFKSDVSHSNIAIFHEYVPISELSPSIENGNYILFLGTPWHVKGLDLLIKAFNSICSSYDGYLKIVGHLSKDDLKFIEKLIGENKKVIIQKPVFYEEAQQIIHNCDFLVLPSRTEAMGRVLLEAMAHKKALVGSSADGIPTYLIDNEYGLIFKSGDSVDLANKILRLIENPELKQKFAENGNVAANTVYSESMYFQNYLKLLKYEFDT